MFTIGYSIIYALCAVGFFILFSCARVYSDHVIVSKLTINAYTKERHYAPVELFLLKTCGTDSLGKKYVWYGTLIVYNMWG